MGLLTTSPLLLGAGPQRFRAGDKIKSGRQVGLVATSPLRFRAGNKFRSAPQVGLMATSHLRSQGFHMLYSGGQNHKCPTSGPGGYITHAIWGVPDASEWGTKSEVPHMWAWCLRHPCHLGGPQRFRAPDKIRSSPQVSLVTTLVLLFRGRSPTFQSRGQNQNCPTTEPGGYITLAVGGGGGPHFFGAGDKIRSAPQVGGWVHHDAFLPSGGPQCFRAGDKIRKAQQVGPVTTS